MGGESVARPVVGQGRAKWSVLLVLAAMAACGRTGLFEDVALTEVDAASGAATATDGGTTDGAMSAQGGPAPDATTLDATAAGDADVATDADARSSACPAPDPAISGRALWASGAQGSISVYATALGAAAGTTAIVGIYRGPVTLGPFALSSALDEDGEYVPQAYAAALDRDGNYLFATAFENVNGPSGFYYDDMQEAFGVALDDAGNVYVAGAFTGEIQFPGSPPGVLATNYPHVQRSSDFGPEFAYVVKLDPRGQHVWSRSFGSLAGGATALALVLAPGGDLVLGGLLEQSIDFAGDDAGEGGPLAFEFASAERRPFVLKLATTGDPLWARVLDSPAYGDVRGLAVDPGGNIFVAGSFEGTLGFVGGGVDAGVIVSCATDAGCTQTGYAVKVTPDGALVWTRAGPMFPQTPTTLGGSGFDGIAVDGNGNASAIGWFYEYAADLDAGTATPGDAGIMVASFDPAGVARWTVTTGHVGPGQDGIACDAVGNVFVAAQTGGNITFPDGYDAGGTPDAGATFLARLRPDGTTAWGYSFPPGALEGAFPLVDPCATELVVAGDLGGNGVTLESVRDGGEVSVGDAAIVVVRIAP